MKRNLLLGSVVLVSMLSCTMWDSPDYEAAVKDMLLMSAVAENEVNTLSKATLPIYDEHFFTNKELDVSSISGTVGASLSGALTNYPESGQNTKYTVTNKGSGVYFVQTETRYRLGSNREVTYEDYYLKDTELDNKLTNADPVCDQNGTTDYLFRARFETNFSLMNYAKSRTVPSLRKETIADMTTNKSLLQYASFDGLDLAQVLQAASYEPSPDQNATYSSKVTYTQEIKTQQIGLSYYLGKHVDLTLDGVRYYTEVPAGSDKKVSSLYFETWKDESGNIVAKTVTVYSYTIDASGNRSSKLVRSRATLYIPNSSPVTFDSIE
ncbi:hypothetical protein [Gracilinema caldarium]|uniref:hypothetical protein n=1 Tax=Gracilinema caldarium TaxID=215591 RepID=UPI0026EBF956|nr:hypothetical protein [Gracilinema caldarium]